MISRLLAMRNLTDKEWGVRNPILVSGISTFSKNGFLKNPLSGDNRGGYFVREVAGARCGVI